MSTQSTRQITSICISIITIKTLFAMVAENTQDEDIASSCKSLDDLYTEIGVNILPYGDPTGFVIGSTAMRQLLEEFIILAKAGKFDHGARAGNTEPRSHSQSRNASAHQPMNEFPEPELPEPAPCDCGACD